MTASLATEKRAIFAHPDYRVYEENIRTHEWLSECLGLCVYKVFHTAPTDIVNIDSKHSLFRFVRVQSGFPHRREPKQTPQASSLKLDKNDKTDPLAERERQLD
jgi:hypothetical protein